MNNCTMNKAVILARGLGTRMRKADAGAKVSQTQADVADLGIKAMIPIDRPFLDYVLHNLAEAGYEHICLVIGPEHEKVRQYYGETLNYSRIAVDFAIQEKPLGTADAVAAVEKFAGDDPFLVINSDNYYPLEALRGLAEINDNGLAGFERQSMLADSNIPADRVTKFAIIRNDGQGHMTEIIEKPDAETLAGLTEPVYLSMNCWRFGPAIFEACRNISLSPRGELELPDAVQYSMHSLGQNYITLPIKAPVLDLSSRDDIASIVEKLKGSPVQL